MTKQKPAITEIPISELGDAGAMMANGLLRPTDIIEEYDGLSFRYHLGEVESDGVTFEISACLQTGNIVFNTRGAQYRTKIDTIAELVFAMHRQRQLSKD